MYNSEWDMYIVRSVIKHFNDYKEDLYMYFPELLDERDDREVWIEFRYNGPTTTETSKNEYAVEIEVDILINAPAEEDIYIIPKLVGQVKKLFTCIEVKDANDNVLCVLELKPDRATGKSLRTINYGRMSGVAKLLASVSGQYTGTFSGV